MPYCCQCGTQVSPTDRFCGTCGAAQPNATQTSPGANAGSSARPGSFSPNADGTGFWNARNAAVLCYVPWFGWIAAAIVLASDRFRRDYEVRFHAFQGLYLFVAWLLVDWVVSPALRGTGREFFQPMPHMGAGVLHLVILAGWIVMIIKTRRGEHYRLPILGDLAERSVAEQRV